jgi:hypothetical protein
MADRRLDRDADDGGAPARPRRAPLRGRRGRTRNAHAPRDLRHKRVAIHGRSGPLLADPLGTAASHGCIRMDNAAVSWLAMRAVEGTPAVVR